MVEIYCKNNNISKKFTTGTSLLQIYEGLELKMPFGVVSAKVNNKVEGLNFKVYTNKDVEFLDITSPSGMRTYVRSLCFVLAKAVKDLFPHGELIVENPVSKGFYCSLHMGRDLTENDVAALRHEMQHIIDANIPYKRVECHTQDAIDLFTRSGMMDKVKLLESCGTLYTYYYKLDDTVDYYYGNLLPSTGFLHLFGLELYAGGLLLRLPSRGNPNELEEMVQQDKMLEVFKEHHRWQALLGISTVGDFNKACIEGHATSLVNVAEALQEKRIAQIAEDIYHRGSKVALVSGPSSSGKTTFSKRLSVQLMTNGLHPCPLSLDNYFIDREHTPRDASGEYDYESLYALDLAFFNQQISTLIAGGEVELPRYNFQTGKREFRGEKLKIEPSTILVIEGIHALNPELTPNIPHQQKYCIYVSALTSLLLDNHNYIPTSDNRLLRRILRDYKYRGYSAEETIARWPSVQAGEEKWIFPFQENADAMFNSALVYELSVLKEKVEPILRRVQENKPEYAEAFRLLRFLEYFLPIQDKDLPPTSLVREFLGGSSFKY